MEYIKGAALPNFTDTWEDENGTPIDFSSGYTFSGKMFDPTRQVLWFTKTTGFTGSAGTNNLAVAWDVNELNITPGDYIFYITATRTSDSKKWKRSWDIRVTANGEATIYIPEPNVYGVPDGGLEDQVLTKLSDLDGDFDWADPQTGSDDDAIIFGAAL